MEDVFTPVGPESFEKIKVLGEGTMGKVCVPNRL